MKAMQNKIKILPDFIANQIAAGEVVQRPESVVKELCENSFDADAKQIGIVIKKAGKQLIHVIDDGSGMTKEDLSLSIRRHATSKLYTQEDLEQIRTFGFRGEALASIAAVSNLEIRTKTIDENHGWRLISEPMKESIIEPINTNIGTQIFVKNLFFNIPARRKFLKSDISEFRYISDTVIRLALSKPEIRFTFYDDANLIFDVEKSDLVERIKNLFGKKIASSLIPINYQDDLIKIGGFIGEPLIAKQSKSGQFIYLNGRYIISKNLSYAVFSAFEHLLEKMQHPFFVINLTIDPTNIDVNVHPQKYEVKFDDERYIFKIINKTISEALANRNLIPSADIELNNLKNPITKVQSNDNELLVNIETGEIIQNKDPLLKQFEQANRVVTNPSQQFKPKGESGYIEKNKIQNFDISAFDILFGQDEKNKHEVDDSNNKKPLPMFWQFHNKYIVTQTEKGIIIIDQHAAHERILYEKALKSMKREFKNTQTLLFPVKVELNTSQLSIFQQIKEYILDLGFSFKENNNEIILEAVPSDIRKGEEESAITDIIEQFEEYEKIRESTKRDNLAASFACKAAIKTGQSLTQEEMQRLLEDLLKCNMPYVCPHGRPIIIEFTIEDLDKRFGRIQ